MGIWQSEMCFRVWPALSVHSAASQGAGAAEDAAGAELGWGVRGLVMKLDMALENIYRFVRLINKESQ